MILNYRFLLASLFCALFFSACPAANLKNTNDSSTNKSSRSRLLLDYELTKSGEPLVKISHQGKILKLPLDKYVASVLAGEVSSSWPMASLKAQAIASRTFALLRMRERKDKPFHMGSTTMDQVYKSHNSKVFTEAAMGTAGLVLSYNNKLAETSFHSTCGGHTASSKNVWGPNYAYLSGVSCGHCQASPSFSWQCKLELQAIEKKYNQKISNINISAKWDDGRAKTIELTGSKTQQISAHDFRMGVDPIRIKSTLLASINVNGKLVEFTGNGFGHGVGMCQYGALGMAKAGRSFSDILYYYYPSTKIKKLY